MTFAVRPAERLAARSGGFTITELLVAATISMILAYAVVQMFDYVASEARYGRASIELAGQLRQTGRRVSIDLSCTTASVYPLAQRDGQGYFEYMEGPGSDSVALVFDYVDRHYTPKLRTNDIDRLRSSLPIESSVGGDFDDVLMFTAYNPDEPFRGRYTPYSFDGSAWTRGSTAIIESKYAEIAIWAVREPRNGRVRLYRRVLLIRPDLLASGYYAAPAPQFPLPSSVADPLKHRIQTFYQENDFSVRYDASSDCFVGNSLSDLSRRENRFAHVRSDATYQFPIDASDLLLLNPDAPPAAPGWALIDDPSRSTHVEGNDVLMGEVLGFDVKAYDPLAAIRFDREFFALTPSDPGYPTDQGHAGAGGALEIRTGAFVDLGYDVTHGVSLSDPTWFSGDGAAKSRLVRPNYFGAVPIVPAPAPDPQASQIAFRTFCTWTSFYEMNAFDANDDGTIVASEGDEDSDGSPDAGSNHIDDDADGVVDDPGEWDTSPPYPRPLRGIQITLRVMEPNTRKIRQMTVVESFVGE